MQGVWSCIGLPSFITNLLPSSQTQLTDRAHTCSAPSPDHPSVALCLLWPGGGYSIGPRLNPPVPPVPRLNPLPPITCPVSPGGGHRACEPQLPSAAQRLGLGRGNGSSHVTARGSATVTDRNCPLLHNAASNSPQQPCHSHQWPSTALP